MEILFYGSIFIGSAILLYFSGELIISNLVRIARFWGWLEFVVAFFLVALAASLSSLFVGVTAAMRGIPELALGDVFGNNFTVMTVAVFLAVMFSPRKFIPAKGPTVQVTTIFTVIAATLPLLLMMDGKLDRIDGAILIGLFLAYVFWLFSKKERFETVYTMTKAENHTVGRTWKGFWRSCLNVGKVFLGIGFVLLAAYGIVEAATFFAQLMGLPLTLIGVLVVGLGSALPETYFAIISARRGETFVILGSLMGAIIFPATLVLGIVTLIHPIVIKESATDLSISRLFLFIAACLFLLAVRSRQRITMVEAFILGLVYVAFLTTLLVVNFGWFGF